ncbi:MAG TPA: flagellar basal body P-ring formation protein FlgA [Pusillimonas sp.]|jgi:flagella basal body P-ring formation protein FlgA|nr:flagellar biosynthesis protein FlgA [Pusillimonas sp.]MBC41932.1 flagellar biosynthesis protein FlgA [Pusillimonas sp.]HBT31459.1 flagellar basal body P-ring formation protein FlgA [Pusillimonas sp.]HCN70218.1 flagellar basal body P-ring formation protein FlgA [Pusillimonas sp.]HCP77786.1 flagellar basal body P-ring formation protein FlgA [Pusillimonas sp.]|tara:strand:+ start:290 stop:997 length:708 start_codon:yes stop_codon:yes gene_type:complete
MRKVIVSLGFMMLALLPFTHGIAQASSPSPEQLNLQKQMLAFLESKAASWNGTLQARIEPPDISNQPKCDHFEIFMPGRGGTLRPTITLGIRCLDPKPWVSYTQASIRIEGSYYITARPVRAGTTLSMQDLEQRQGDLLRLPRGTLVEPEQLVGYITRYRLNARKPIKASAIRSPLSIERGQMVHMEVRGVGFVARSEGKAMEDGEPGDHIQVRTSSGQTVTATILDAHTVLIPM